MKEADVRVKALISILNIVFLIALSIGAFKLGQQIGLHQMEHEIIEQENK